jgi:hypothetical protein
MGLCQECRHNKNGYCAFFTSRTVVTENMQTCTGFKAMPTGKTNNIKKKSVKQEKRLAKDLGAKRAPKSGAISTSPEDMLLGNYVIESKATKGKSISVKEEWLSALRESPIHFGRIPTLSIEFGSGKRYLVIEENDFKRIIKQEEQDNENT